MKAPHLMLAIGAVTLGGVGALALLPPANAGAQDTKTPASSAGPILLELFTSQGCSSCPPADKLAEKLAQDPSLLVLSRPVTYWDRLGWKDTLGREANTALQRGYAARGNKGAGVYTPQMVVDGRHGAVGSNERIVRALVRDAEMADRPTLTATKLANGGAGVAVKGPFKRSAELMLIAYSAHEDVKIARGENGGRTVSYTNVVLDETLVARPSAANQSFAIPAAKMRIGGADRYAVILRRPGAGQVLAARIIRQ